MSLEKDIASMTESIGLDLYTTAVLNENDETIFRVSVVAKNKEAVTLDQCVELSNLLSPLLDVTPPVSGNYRLEVSSAGIERKVETLEQYRLSIGESISMTLLDKTKLKGKLEKVEDSKLYFLIGEDIEVVEFGTIRNAKTYFEW